MTLYKNMILNQDTMDIFGKFCEIRERGQNQRAKWVKTFPPPIIHGINVICWENVTRELDKMRR